MQSVHKTDPNRKVSEDRRAKCASGKV
jgi:hypothetical protein